MRRERTPNQSEYTIVYPPNERLGDAVHTSVVKLGAFF